MADQSQVEAALVRTILSALYPAGTIFVPNQTPPASNAGMSVRVYRGWPVPDALTKDINAGVVNVSVFPLPTSRNTTRWLPQASSNTPGVATLTASLNGAQVAIAGTPATGQVIGIACDNIGYAYRAVGTEASAAAVAAIIAAEIPGATVTGAVITLPTDIKCSAQVVADATVSTEYGRIERQFQVSLWCPSPQTRDVVGSLVVPQIVSLSFLPLPNGEAGRVRYVADVTSDKDENSGDFRRDVRFSVDYPVSITQAEPSMLFGIGNLMVPNSGVVVPFDTQLPLGTFEADASGDIIQDQAGSILADSSV